MTTSKLLTRCTGELDYLRNLLQKTNSAATGDLIATAAHEFALSMAYVHISSTLESFHNELIQLLIASIANSGIVLKDVRRSLLGLLLHPGITGSAAGNSLKVHRKRASLFLDAESARKCTFTDGARPTDDRTIKSEHYETLWEIFGLPGSPMPSVTHSAVLNEIAEYRNKLVHGRMPYLVFPKQKNLTDVLKAIDRIDEILAYVCTAADSYISATGYRR